MVLEGRDRLNGVPGTYRVVRCKTCSLERTDPRPTADTIAAYYPSTYAPYADGHAELVPQTGSGWKRTLRRWLGFETRQLPPLRPPGALLEVGCAAGAWLLQMQRQGWSVLGVEFSQAAAFRAHEKGLSVQIATVETATPPDPPVDVVAAWMVLEHLHEPLVCLRRLRQWTRPGGWLVAAVPDSGSWVRKCFGARAYELQLPTHLYHYTPQTLGRLLADAGWRLDSVAWQRNPNNLLWSLEYLADDYGWPRAVSAVRWLRTAPAAGRLRAVLGWLLGITRQSGRIEIRAVRVPDAS